MSTILLIIESICIIIGKMFILGKMGEEEWKGIIPIYSEYLIFKHCWDTDAYILFMILSVFLCCYPAITALLIGLNVPGMMMTIIQLCFAIMSMVWLGIIIALAYKLAKAFGHGAGYTVGLLLLQPIFVLILGLNQDRYLQAA